ncbi:single-stranded telomeric DNA-binding/mRNA-binding protein [Saccharomycopsis crataegensis]|uniref:Single-stranded telomeric DNA-binding/mRNA-binding protein n=1 Tax=Saccharomycopsis crataegensis TaxID=43959 RepID=A0AAV5QDX4_9ASCO|nr:single-stranded telomeric DNA-binding/mRNA-binding protein [Saccharomycopsis crataegensis]
MSDRIDIDDYPRDRERSRSRSPRRDRSPVRGSDRGGYRSRRDYRDSGRDRYDSRGRGDSYSGGGRDRYSGRGRSSDLEDPARFSSNGAYADKSNRNYSSSIFIGNLPFDCSWMDLKDHFSRVGDVSRADIVTSHGKSRGMGTVEFKDKRDVQVAIDKFNHTSFLDREIFVREDNPPPGKSDRGRDRYDDDRYSSRDSYRGRDSYRERDSYRGGDSYRDSYRDRDSYRGGRYEGRDGGRDSYRGRDGRSSRLPPKGYEVFVGNLPFRTNWQDLKDLFRDAGDVLHADVREDERGRSKGFGIVVYATREEADRAIEKFQDHEIDGRKIDVRDGKNNAYFDKDKEADSVAPADTVAVNHGDDIEMDTKAEQPIEEAVNTEEQEDEDTNEFTSGVVGEGEESDTIFVGNLPFSTHNEDLYDLLEGVGAIAKAEIQKSHGRPKGSGVVRFENESDAKIAIEQLNGYTYGGRQLNISYASYPKK